MKFRAISLTLAVAAMTAVSAGAATLDTPRSGLPGADELTEYAAWRWDAEADDATATVADEDYEPEPVAGSASLRFETDGCFDTRLWTPVDRDADWDLTETGGLAVSIYAENSNWSFQDGSPWFRLYTTEDDYIELHATDEFLNEAEGQWVAFAIPLAGDSLWSRTEVGDCDLEHIAWLEIHADTWDCGFTLWFDNLRFTPSGSSGFFPNVYWSGLGGDIWNTASSPFEVDPTNPFAVLWSSPSEDEGDLHRPSGLVLADVGASEIPYLFGSTGWWQNGVYRRERETGDSPDWSVPTGENDSGTGFRIALSPDGSRLYHIDAANWIRAYPTEEDPYGEELWSADGESLSIRNAIKVGPDGLIYGHSDDGMAWPAVAALDPATGELVWWQDIAPGTMHFPGAFWQTEDSYRYVIAGADGVLAYDIAQDPESDPLWEYIDFEDGYAPPTIDPATGDIYVFRSDRLLKLDADGQFLWNSPTVDPGEIGRSTGALSRDGQTYYYQTGSDSCTGKLYAYQTSDGSVKWTYPTGARVHYEQGVGGPIVASNGIVFVANGATDEWGADNLIFCIEDSAGVAPVLRGTFDLHDSPDCGGPWLAIGPGGVLYFDAWAAPDDPMIFACQSHEITLPVPDFQRATALNQRILIQWEPLDDPGEEFACYRIYRDTTAFGSVAGMTPLAEATDPEESEYMDETAVNGVSYWYAVTTRSTSGTEDLETTGVGPRTPRDETDLQVVCLARTPRFPRYDVGYTDYEITEPSGFGPYAFTAATGLGGGQTPETQRWPDPGDPIEFTATIRNRGTNDFNGTLTAFWTNDGSPAQTDVRAVAMAPGDTIQLVLPLTADTTNHEIAVALESADARPENDTLTAWTRSVPFLSYVDQTRIEQFREETAGYPEAETDDFLDWLNRHAARMNEMFAEKDSPKRVHYDVLAVLDDPEYDPGIDRIPFAIFPFRFYANEGSLRLSGYYDPATDLDRGLIHEMSHQLGLIDLYQFNLGSGENQVSGEEYVTVDGMMMNCSPFYSDHSALAMTHWQNCAHGYYGQYLYSLPESVRLYLVGTDDLPLAGATVTVYQMAERPGQGKVITDQVKAQGVTDAEGYWTLPNVEISDSLVPPALTGDELHDNPFGYVAVVGTNGLLLIHVEKDGYEDYCWLDIAEVNVAYWQGQTGVATFERRLMLGGTVEHLWPEDMAEENAESWTAWAEGATAAAFDDLTLKHVGEGSIRMETDGGGDTYLRYPGDHLASWDLSEATELRLWCYADNPSPYGFQGPNPLIRLIGEDGYLEFNPEDNLLGAAEDQWAQFVIPLSGDETWILTQVGTADLSDIRALEIHADTWDNGFTLWVDGVGFWPRPATSVPNDGAAPPARLVMAPAMPNPFNPSTTIAFEVPHNGHVSLTIHDIRGRRVAKLADKVLPAGRHRLVWKGLDDTGRAVASGVYFARIEHGGRAIARKLVLVR
ncbi:MAG: PQQ-binding-like beta-propeller repeat protein [Candidatus Eisenbacteria bacterium]|nr:PQQ-binding-like beta-propeller repeat protein [Candidatus Eisenbacteria bacterium]